MSATIERARELLSEVRLSRGELPLNSFAKTALILATLCDELEAMTDERDALQRHYDAASPEHNLLALLDSYESDRDSAVSRAASAEAALGRAREACRQLGMEYDAPLSMIVVRLHERAEKAERERDEALARPGTYEHALRIARGCLDYLGGYSGHDLRVYHHGVCTVVAAVGAGLAGDAQTDALASIGADTDEVDALRAEVERLQAAMPTQAEMDRLRQAMGCLPYGANDAYCAVRDALARLDAARTDAAKEGGE